MKKITHVDSDPDVIKKAILPSFEEFITAWHASQRGSPAALAAFAAKMDRAKAAIDKAKARKAARNAGGGNG